MQARNNSNLLTVKADILGDIASITGIREYTCMLVESGEILSLSSLL